MYINNIRRRIQTGSYIPVGRDKKLRKRARLFDEISG
jgi:hypothetical protein